MWGGGGEGNGGLKSILLGHNPSPLVLPVVYTKHLFSLSENIRSNEYRDETTIRAPQQELTEMLQNKKTNSLTLVGPASVQSQKGKQSN